jgi:uncharacterized Zn-binding protein involved in type VI secretion
MKSVTRTIRLRRGAAALCCGLLVAAAASHSATAAGCRFEPQGEGRVLSVIDNRTFRLEDGREIRLAGIQTVTTGSAALATLITGRDVTLRGETDAPDRWGRQPAFVFAGGSDASIQGSDTSVQGSDTSVQGLLLTQGERWFQLISPTRAAPPSSPPPRRRRGRQSGEAGRNRAP